MHFLLRNICCLYSLIHIREHTMHALGISIYLKISHDLLDYLMHKSFI